MNICIFCIGYAYKLFGTILAPQILFDLVFHPAIGVESFGDMWNFHELRKIFGHPNLFHCVASWSMQPAVAQQSNRERETVGMWNPQKMWLTFCKTQEADWILHEASLTPTDDCAPVCLLAAGHIENAHLRVIDGTQQPAKRLRSRVKLPPK